jgi:hypothetical protein
MYMRNVAVLMLAVASLFGGSAFANARTDLFFVSTRQELKIAQMRGCHLQGLAVSADFYAAQPRKTRQAAKKLVRQALNCKNIAVLIYGRNFDHALLTDLLGVDVGEGSALLYGWLHPSDGSKGVAAYSEPNMTEKRLRTIVAWSWNKNH